MNQEEGNQESDHSGADGSDTPPNDHDTDQNPGADGSGTPPNDTTKSKLIPLLLNANKISDWKNTLSGALDDQRLFWALFVLGVFYIFYTLVDTIYTYNDNKDEDSITEMCKCSPHHRLFYIIWFSLCFLLWAVCHFSVAIADSKDYFKKCNKECKKRCNCSKTCTCSCDSSNQSEGKLGKLKIDRFKCCIYSCFCCCCWWLYCCCCCCWWWYCCCCCCCLKPLYAKFRHYVLDKDKLSRYEFHLWTQYCELYVIGITKNTETFNLDRVETIIKETLQKSSESNSEVVLDNTTVLPKYHETCDWRYILQVTFFIFLKLIQLIAQLSIVPLMIIQMFDTYAFLCFAADSYCSTRAEYNLHLDQTAFTFGFYAALMTSLLSTLMLQWNPWPELCDKKSKNSYNISCCPPDTLY